MDAVVSNSQPPIDFQFTLNFWVGPNNVGKWRNNLRNITSWEFLDPWQHVRNYVWPSSLSSSFGLADET